MSASVSSRDNGMDALLRRLSEPARSVRVGVIDDAPKKSRDDKSSAYSLLEVAAVHEFGEPEAGIPQRSFIRGTVDAREAEIKTMQSRQAQAIVKGLHPNVALEQLGAVVQGMIQQRIATSIEPPNAPSTIERKGSSTTLVDTGQLRSSIAYRVETASAK